jgi:hypothetical protein
MMPDLPRLERKLRGVRQEVRNLQVMQMRPGQSAEKLKLLSDLERSARAEVKLRVKALAYAKSQLAPRPPSGDRFLLTAESIANALRYCVKLTRIVGQRNCTTWPRGSRAGERRRELVDSGALGEYRSLSEWRLPRFVSYSWNVN